jgi:hypothetical protein
MTTSHTQMTASGSVTPAPTVRESPTPTDSIGDAGQEAGGW